MAGDLDWILKAAIATQDTAHRSFVRGKPELRPKDDGLTLAVLGCGTMGTAVLGGILDSLESTESSGTNVSEKTPLRLPTRFNACVKSARGASRVHSELDRYNANLQVFENDNLTAIQEADVILLACEPHGLEHLLQAEGMNKALAGKLLISILAGVSQQRLHDILAKRDCQCTIVRAMPNTAAAVRESMTVIASQNPPLPEDTVELLDWIFTRIGKVVHLPESNMNAGTALCGAGPAFCALVVESLAAGAIRMGLPREEAYTMAAQVMKGTSGLLQKGEHPALLREKVCTPGGGTIAGLQVLEEGAVRGTISKAIGETARVAGHLGQIER